MGYVYVIGIEGSSLVKVGSTVVAPEKRLKALQIGSPYTLKLLKVFQCQESSLVESRIHRFLQEKNTRGEWFEVSIDEVEEAFQGSLEPAQPRSEFSQCFGKRIRKLRRARDWTQHELENRSGLHYTTISRLEKGHSEQIYIETLIKLAKAFEMSLDRLVYGEEEGIEDMEPSSVGFGETLRQWREQRGMTRQQLIDVAFGPGHTPAYRTLLEEIEQDHAEFFLRNVQDAVSLAKALGCTVEDLVEGRVPDAERYMV